MEKPTISIPSTSIDPNIRGVDSLVAAAPSASGSYVALSGESYTEAPLKSQDGLAALALSRRKWPGKNGEKTGEMDGIMMEYMI